MGLGEVDIAKMWTFDDDTNDALVAVMDKHLPAGWKENRVHRRQVYRVVENFLETPVALGTKEREHRARKKTVHQEETVDTGRTIVDATGRRLYTHKPFRETFRENLEQIEQDYRNR